MKHSVIWWIFIGWWWYLCVAWWLYPIKKLLFGKHSTPNTESEYSFRFLHETEDVIMDSLNKSNNRTALQVDVKNTLSSRLSPYFDDAVHELYQNGKIKMSKEGNRVRLELC